MYSHANSNMRELTLVLILAWTATTARSPHQSGTEASRIEVEPLSQQVRLLHGPQPAYPAQARKDRIEGKVTLSAVIDREGRVAELTLVSGDSTFVPAAMDAVRRWRYAPTLRNGQPVEVVTRIEVEFRLAYDLDQGLQAFRSVAEANPGGAEAHYVAGVELKHAREFERSAAEFREATRRNPEFFEAYLQLAFQMLILGRLDEQADAYKEAVRIRPDSVHAQEALSEALLKVGDLDGAITAFRRAVLLQPYDERRYKALAHLLNRRGDAARAAAEFREVSQLAPDPAALRRSLAQEFERSRYVDAAIAEYQEVLRIDPGDTASQAALTRLSLRREQNDQKVRDLQQALRSNPNDARAHDQLASRLLGRQDYDGAIAHIREALRLRPQELRLYLLLTNRIQWRYGSDRALAEAENLLVLHPDSGAAHVAVGSALMWAGGLGQENMRDRLDRAIILTRDGIRLGADNEEAHRLLSLLLQTKGQQREADLESEMASARARLTTREWTAFQTLREINTACLAYQEEYGGFPPSLRALGPQEKGQPPNREAADLIAAALAGGSKGGYRFTYTPGHTDGAGQTAGYSITAEPVSPQATQRRYYTDHPLIIRQARGRTANASDPPIE